jgi:hypothetical protein
MRFWVGEVLIWLRVKACWDWVGVSGR